MRKRPVRERTSARDGADARARSSGCSSKPATRSPPVSRRRHRSDEDGERAARGRDGTCHRNPRPRRTVGRRGRAARGDHTRARTVRLSLPTRPSGLPARAAEPDVRAAILAAAIVSTLTVDLGPAVRSARGARGIAAGSSGRSASAASAFTCFAAASVVEDMQIDGRQPGDRPFFTAQAAVGRARLVAADRPATRLQPLVGRADRLAHARRRWAGRPQLSPVHARADRARRARGPSRQR